MPVISSPIAAAICLRLFAGQGRRVERVRGVVLLDALYGEDDKFGHWIERAHTGAFFVSAYSTSTHEENLRCAHRLERDGVTPRTACPTALRPGVVAFIDSGDVGAQGLRNIAWTSDPLSAVLSRVDR